MNLINKIIRLSLSRSSVVWHSEAVKNGQPSMYIFDGGYASFGTNGAVDGWHYYIQDYMGNNRMVVNKNGTVEQVTHYYPYGGVIGDISTNENLQKYKFEGKELDRTFGLDNYDVLARQYYAMMPSWDRIDPLAEKYYGISPYAYCGGDPVNRMDVNGDSIQLFGNIFDIVIAIYNALPKNTNMRLMLHNGVVDPNSIPDSDDPFLQDFKAVASHDQMVIVTCSDSYNYINDYEEIQLYEFPDKDTPVDFQDPVEVKGYCLETGSPWGKSVNGTTGRSLFFNSTTGARSPDNNLHIIINSKGSLNHRTVGFAHELIHIRRYLNGESYTHLSNDFNLYLFNRMMPLLNRLGYDY